MTYDYIFCGFGLSAIVVLEELLDSGLAAGKSILIIDEQSVPKQDKTWCFWEEGAGKWEFALAKTWSTALFTNHQGTVNCLDGKMQYKMLDSDKLHAYINLKIGAIAHIKMQCEKVIAAEQLDGFAMVVTENNTYQSTHVFSSIYDKTITAGSKFPLLLQHFIGWYVKVDDIAFPEDTAILMDFTVNQNNETRFMYVLPLSDFEFLLEFTIFSPEILSESSYESELKMYLEKKGIFDYQITKTEKGVIPMTSHPFWKRNTANILYIGTAGGWTKSSTGYTFTNARLKAQKLSDFLTAKKSDFRNFHKTDRFYWYDQMFVSVLFSKNSIGYKLFSGLFLKSQPGDVLRFLDEKSTLFDEVKIIWACPKRPFLTALLKIVFCRRTGY